MTKQLTCDCRHWTPRKARLEGNCALGHYNGKGVVLLDHCASCTEYDGSRTKLVQLRNTVRVIQQQREQNITDAREGRPVTLRTESTGRTCATKVQRWLGIRWYGVPKPIRWWRRWFHFDPSKEWPGCGCMVRPKNATIAARKCWQAWRWWWTA